MTKEVLDFLNANRPFYMATVEEGGIPRVRPMGFVMEHEGKLWFGMGTHKNVYKQLKANPKVEITTTASPSNDWLRISAEAVFDTRPELFKAALEVMPHLREIYPEGGPTMGICKLEKGEAIFANIKGVPYKTVKL
jgi:uncharacterized pyridoxamine 5'-phosphate oxidase family protein